MHKDSRRNSIWKNPGGNREQKKRRTKHELKIWRNHQTDVA